MPPVLSTANNAVTDGLDAFEELVLESKSTRKGYNVGVAAYNTFAESAALPLLSNLDVTDIALVKSCMRRFATFLLKHKKKDGKHYKPDSQCQYMSNVKTALAKQHPKATLFRKDHEDSVWYSELLAGLKNRGRAEAAKRGEAIRESTVGIRRTLLTRIANHLFQKGDSTSMEERAVLCMLYHAIGRGGEVSTTNFDLLRWDEDDEALWTAWNQVKTGRCGDISFHPDSEGYAIDMLHAIACYIISAGGRLCPGDPDSPDWLFPTFADLADGGATSKASRILKSLIGIVEGVEACHTSHGLRAGPTDDLAEHILVDIVAMIARGDWDWEGECQIFGYLTNRMHVQRGGKGLAFWPNPKAKVAAPSLEALSEADQKRADELAFHLFYYAPDCLHGRLKRWRDAMTASLIQYFADMEKDCNYHINSNVILTKMKEAAQQSKISLREIREWGDKIGDCFRLANIANQAMAAKKVYEEAMKHATKEEKSILASRNLKTGGQDGYTEWANSVKDASTSIATKLQSSLQHECKELKVDFTLGKKTKTTCPIGSTYCIVEKLIKARKLPQKN